ncbi:MAG: hypothetical protein HC841_05790, partial [Verrucomicrobiae bacterium]|nr:hypothetical protein [Verrucomicrobiae bacterium]
MQALIDAIVSGDQTRWVPLAWAALLATAVALYVILDGFDLGIGILFPFMPAEDDRDVMMNSVAPFWDGNETWLILGGGGLFVAFPLAYGIIMPAVYLPMIIMLLALVFRGVAFEFRWVAKRSLFAVPFLGWMMWMAGYVGIKRGDARSRERMLAKCRRQLELGNTILDVGMRREEVV